MNVLSKPLLLLSLTACQIHDIASCYAGYGSAMVNSNISTKEMNVWHRWSPKLEKSKRENLLEEDIIVSSKEMASEMKYFHGLKSIQQVRAAIGPIIRAKITAQKKADHLLLRNYDLENELDALKRQTEKLNRASWVVVIRAFLDDVEAIYKHRYQQFLRQREEAEKKRRDEYMAQKAREEEHEPLYPTPDVGPSEDANPEEFEIQKKAATWDYFTAHLADERLIKEVLEEMKREFRKTHKPPIAEEEILTAKMGEEFQSFRKKSCYAIGVAYMSASIRIRGSQVVDLINGRLRSLNEFGSHIDAYLLPVLNALVPLMDETAKAPNIFELSD